MGGQVSVVLALASFFLQGMTCALALTLIRRERARVWLLFSGGLGLMAIGRFMVLLWVLGSPPPNNVPHFQLIDFGTSLLLLVGVMGIRSLLSTLGRARDELQRVSEEYRALLESTDDSVYLVDREGRFLYINPRYLSRLGVSAEEAVGKFYGDFHGEEETREFMERVRRVWEKGESERYEHRSLRDGRYFLRTLSPVKDANGKVMAVTVVSKDITDLKKVQLELSFLATHDPLTGLPNRALFMDRLKVAILQAQRSPHPMAVMFVDLDDFKKVNDAYGHRVGDALLRAIGKRLRGALRRSDTVARIGGDEFVVLLPDLKEPEDSGIVACHLLEQLSLPFEVEGRTFEVSASIGIALYPDHGTDPEALIMTADKAMYEAKKRGCGYWIWGLGCLKEKGTQGREG